jgi:hypothetical protein
VGELRRIASVIGIPDEHMEEYERLHAEVWPGVLARITALACHAPYLRAGDLIEPSIDGLGAQRQEVKAA